MAGFKTESELIWGSPENDRLWEARPPPIMTATLAAPTLWIQGVALHPVSLPQQAVTAAGTHRGGPVLVSH